MAVSKRALRGRVSRFLGIGRSQAELDFVDIDIYSDTPLFVNPGALRREPGEWAAECTELMRDFMSTVLNHIKAKDIASAYALLINLGEPNETRLGMSDVNEIARGHAVGNSFTELIIDAVLKSPAGKSGLIVDLEDTVMMIEGIGSDIISDMTTNIIRGPLIDYTNTICEGYGVDMSAFTSRRDQFVWNPDIHEWHNPEVTLPIANGKPLILVPKWLVRKQVNSMAYFRDYLAPFIGEREVENPNSMFVRVLKDKTRRPDMTKIRQTFSTKQSAVELLLSDKRLRDKYREAVDAGEPDRSTRASALDMIDVDGPSIEKLLEEALALPPGQAAAHSYEQAMDRLFAALFSTVLRFPRPQQPQNQGQKRLDVLWTNAARSGFFSWVKDQCNASYVISEYKNYSADVGNPEFDQLAMRFGPSKGQFGFLISRKIEDREAALQRARSIATDKHGFIIALDDSDMRLLVKTAKDKGDDGIFAFLVERFTEIAHRA